MPGAPDPLYVRARRVLLDALEALREQLAAVILVGAQAIYLHTGEGDLAVAPYTTDADLALNPAALADDPGLDALMRAAGFAPAPGAGEIGRWVGQEGVPVDLLVPAALSGPGRRAARLGAHGNRVARRAAGLEGALVDNMVMTIEPFEPDDRRRIQIKVAGPSALLVAKLHKIGERRDSPGKQDDKDALDVYRLLRALRTEVLVAGTRELLANPLSRQVTQEAVVLLYNLFGTAGAPGSRMAARALQPLEDPETTAASCAALAGDMLAVLPR